MDAMNDLRNLADQSDGRFRESNEHFRLLVEGVSEYAIYMLDPTGRIVSWNTGGQRIKGYTKDEVIGQHFSLFFAAEDIARGKPATLLEIAAREGKYQEEGWRVRKDGSRFWASVLLSALYDTNGQLRGFGKVTRDMTERKLAEEQREQLREREQQLQHERAERAQIEMVERMRDSFLTVLAHELRTPLTSLLGNAEIVLRRGQREGSLSERDQRNMKVIINQATRLNDMISLQLDISRLHTGQLQIERMPLDVGVIAQQVVEEFLPTATAHTLTYAGSDQPLLVEGNALRLIQVLQNLVQNAIKYSPAGGAVRLQVEQHDTAVRIAVSDTGIGIPQAELPHLFQRFYRASNVDERQISGLGVGLYVVRELVTLHGGSIDVVSEEGQGSTFTITLPLFVNQSVQGSSE
jgi:PAS domain S-box-containing protein